MKGLPRLALGTIQPDADLEPMLWALLEVLRRAHVLPQVFVSRSHFTPVDVGQTVSGRCQRHLDSWLMPPDVCRRAFFLGSQGSDLSLVLGQFTGSAAPPCCLGGTLDTLAEWLQLPSIVLLDVSRGVLTRPLHLPPGTAGVLLDRVPSNPVYLEWQRKVELQTQVPVLGGLSGAVEETCRLGGGEHRAPHRDEIRRLADDLSRRLRLDVLLDLARQTTWSTVDATGPDCHPCWRGVTVAIALDEAFRCYFPDTLDALEMQGARLCDFSPLKSECLPPHSDLVLLGCGQPERYAERLAANVCLKQSLLAHVRAGRRVYAEGGGLAYICQALCVGSRGYPMAGLLPAIARFQPTTPQPIELRLACNTWLGKRQAMVRGYLSGNWHLETAGPLVDFVDDPQHRLQLVGFRQVIGSRVHLHFAAQTELLHNLLRPLSNGDG